MSKKALGRGFGSLIPTGDYDEDFDPTAEEDKAVSKVHEISIDDIIPDADQPRHDFDQFQLKALADSIKEHGVLQPILVTKEDDKYKIVAGERRWRASKMAGLDKIPAIIRTLEAQKRLEISLIENVQRQDLNAIETATAYAKLKEQFNLTTADIAKRVGKSETSIINTMRLLVLPESAKHQMVENKLTEGQMRPLITAEPEEIEEVLPKIIAEGWSARKVEQYMVDLKARRKAKKEGNPDKAGSSRNDTRANNISNRLGVKVTIHTNAKGAGNITLKFKDEKELEKLCSTLTA